MGQEVGKNAARNTVRAAPCCGPAKGPIVESMMRGAKQLLQPCHTCANCCQVQVFSARREVLASKEAEAAEGGVSLSTGERLGERGTQHRPWRRGRR